MYLGKYQKCSFSVSATGGVCQCLIDRLRVGNGRQSKQTCAEAYKLQAHSVLLAVALKSEEHTSI